MTPHPDRRARRSARSSATRCRSRTTTSWSPPGTPGAVRLHGRVLDGAGEPVPDAILELWQADADGQRRPGAGLAAPRRLTPSPASAARRPTRDGPLRLHDRWCPGAPFFAITVFARGLLNRLFTRAYLPGRGRRPFLDGARRGPPLDAAHHAGRDWLRVRRAPAGRPGDRLPDLPAPLSADDRPVLARRPPSRRPVHRRAPSSRRWCAVESAWVGRGRSAVARRRAGRRGGRQPGDPAGRVRCAQAHPDAQRCTTG